MNRTLKRSIRLGRTNSEYYIKKRNHVVAKSDCKVKIKSRKIICKLKTPVPLGLSRLQQDMFNEEIYQALDEVISKYLGVE